VISFLTKLANIGVAGFRVDASKHIDAGDLAHIHKKTAPGTSVFWFQEVFASKWEAVTVDEYTHTGALEYFEYARRVSPAFAKAGQLDKFHEMSANWNFVPSDKAVVFLDNHDTQRSEAPLTFRHGRIYELATIFMLGHPYGYPKVMSSYYFENHDQGRPEGPVHDMDRLACTPSADAMEKPVRGRPWVCEHRWHTIANMVAWRRSAGDAKITAWWAMDGNRLFFCRGKSACLVINRHETQPWKARLSLKLPMGNYCDVIRSDNTTSCPTVDVGRDGHANIEVRPLSAVAMHIGKMSASQFV
jgi:alpha-amylase